MNCYVCGTPRPDGANYCPGCGRYCADDPNVKKNTALPVEEIIIEEPFPMESSVPENPLIPMDEPIPEDSVEPEEPAPVSDEAEPEAVSDPIPEASEAPKNSVPPVVEETPPKKKKKHRPVLIPVLAMVCLFVVGSVCWFLMPLKSPESPSIPGESAAPTEPTGETGSSSGGKRPLPPGKNKTGTTAPTETFPPTDAACFRMENGIVSFISERYDGSPILVIPSEIDGQTVTAIAPGGFSGLEDVTTLILPDTLETIGDFAFADCKKLRGVYIPDSVKTIASGAFAGCIDMESVSIPAETTEIGFVAFHGCASLMYIFYEGTYEEWMELYNEYITPFTFACCSDGDYYHGVYTE